MAAIRRGDERAFKVWILGTATLGSTFLGFQVFEFREFWLEGLTPRTNLFGTTFFVLTGFHGAHVTVGVIWLVSLFGQSLQGNLKQENSLRVEIAGLYWHFVDIVWISPTVITGKAVINRKEVIRVIHVKGGIRMRLIPGALRLIIVTMKLKAPAIDETPSTSRPRL